MSEITGNGAAKVISGHWTASGIVRDKYGRVCLDEQVFFDDVRLANIIQAVRNEVNARTAAVTQEA